MNLDLIQMSAVDKLSTLKAGALFMKMGTGKTKTAIDLIRTKLQFIDKVVWIAPASLLSEKSYKDEIAKWCEFTDIILYFTIEGVSQSDTSYVKLVEVADNNRCFCIIDESIKIKNIAAKRTNRLLRIYDKFSFRLILNGTPITKGLMDFLPQLDFISPKILSMDEAQFANNYLEYFNDGRKPWNRWSRPANEKALIETIRPYIFDSDLDITSKIIQKDVEFDLSPDERENYQDAKDDYFSRIHRIDFIAMSQKFQQLYTLCNSKLDAVAKTVGNDQFIIFVKFLSEVDRLKQIIPNSEEYTGRGKASIDDFRNGRFGVLICTYGSGAFGLNLQFCHNILFFTQTFDYKDKIQALHRVYRSGQAKDVNYYNFYVKVGLEKIIRKSLDKKQSTAYNVKKFIEARGVKDL